MLLRCLLCCHYLSYTAAQTCLPVCIPLCALVCTHHIGHRVHLAANRIIDNVRQLCPQGCILLYEGPKAAQEALPALKCGGEMCYMPDGCLGAQFLYCSTLNGQTAVHAFSAHVSDACRFSHKKRQSQIQRSHARPLLLFSTQKQQAFAPGNCNCKCACTLSSLVIKYAPSLFTQSKKALSSPHSLASRLELPILFSARNDQYKLCGSAQQCAHGQSHHCYVWSHSFTASIMEELVWCAQRYVTDYLIMLSLTLSVSVRRPLSCCTKGCSSSCSACSRGSASSPCSTEGRAAAASCSVLCPYLHSLLASKKGTRLLCFAWWLRQDAAPVLLIMPRFVWSVNDGIVVLPNERHTGHGLVGKSHERLSDSWSNAPRPQTL